VLADRDRADVVLAHQFRQFGDRSVGAYPVDALGHRVFDFHRGPPCVRVHRSNAPPVPNPPIEYTISERRGGGVRRGGYRLETYKSFCQKSSGTLATTQVTPRDNSPAIRTNTS